MSLVSQYTVICNSEACVRVSLARPQCPPSVPLPPSCLPSETSLRTRCRPRSPSAAARCQSAAGTVRSPGGGTAPGPAPSAHCAASSSGSTSTRHDSAATRTRESPRYCQLPESRCPGVRTARSRRERTQGPVNQVDWTGCGTEFQVMPGTQRTDPWSAKASCLSVTASH